MRTMRDKALALLPPTPAQQIEALKKRVATLEGQVLNCLKFMRYHAEKEIKELDQSQSTWTPGRAKAEA
jgi:hypothetical protein